MTSDLAELMHRYFASAKTYWVILILLQALGFVLALCEILSDRVPVPLTILLFVVPVATFVAQQAMSSKKGRGEEIRRSFFWLDSLGFDLPLAERLQVRVDEPILAASDPRFERPYFQSRQPLGYRRFCENLVESAHYTSDIAKKSAVLFGGAAIVGMIISIVFAISGFGSEATLEGIRTARVFAGLVGFFSVGVFAGLFLAYLRLSGAASHVMREVCALLEMPGQVSPQAATFLAGTYDSALAEAPLLPGFLYAWRKKSLASSILASGKSG